MCLLTLDADVAQIHHSSSEPEAYGENMQDLFSLDAGHKMHK